MNKLKIFTVAHILCFLGISGADAYWWLPPTVCQLDTSQCYTGVYSGIAPEFWDSDEKCWGMKYVCPDALVKIARDPQPMGKKDLSNKANFKSDYDVNLYSASDDCYGIRRINKEGNQVYVDNRYVNIWCHGILDNPDETLTNGEIVYGTQPTCETLKENGYAAINMGKCFGKYYDENEYYIECGNALLPSRLIVLNGGYYGIYNDNFPAVQSDADDVFDVMYQNSQEQKSKYFN